MSSNLVYTLSQPNLSLGDCIKKVKQSSLSAKKLENNVVKPFKNFKKHEITQELHERGIKFFSSDNVANLQVLLDREMVGIQRLPALLFYASHESLIELNLGHYEILNNEPLQEISHYT